MCRFIARALVVALLIATSFPWVATPLAAQSARTGAPPPEDCTGDPITAAQIVAALRGEGVTPDGPDAIPLIGIEESELPAGEEPDPADLAAAIDVVWAATACANAGDFSRFFGHLTPNAIHALVMGLLEALGRPAAPFTDEELADLEANLAVGLTADPEALVGDDRARIDAIRGARVLPDGRLLLLSDGRLVLDGTGYLIMVEVDGVWKADRLGQIGDVDMLGLGTGETAPPTTRGGEPTPAAGDDTSAGTTPVPPGTLPESVALNAMQTLVYHEITAWETAPNLYGEEAPILSGDGRTIAFARSPGSGDPANPNRIYAMDADGTNEREVDAYTTLCFCGSMIDISADGGLILSSDSVQLRVAPADGSGGRSLLTLVSNEINAARISGDGSTVAFRVYRDTAIKDTGEPVPAGFYAIDASGENLRLLAGIDDVAALYGVPREGVPTAGPPHALDVSHDGRWIAASVMVEPESGGINQGLILIDATGGLAALLGPDEAAYVTNVAISADGATVAYVMLRQETGVAEAGVIGLPDGERRILTNSSAEPPGINQSLTGSLERIQLTADGSLLLLGGTGLLFDTASGAMLTLSANDGAFYSGDPPALGTGRTDFGTMDDRGSRVLYLALNAVNVNQAVILEINPGDAGAAPAIADVTLAGKEVGVDRNGAATLTAEVDAAGDYLRVGVVVLRDGRPDSNMSRYGVLLADDGVNQGDVAAGDGVFTIDSIAADCCALPGPRTIRVKAETVDADGRRHATAVDVAGPTVTD